MKKSVKKTGKPAKTIKESEKAQKKTLSAPAVSTPGKPSTAERARQRAEASRKAALNKAVSQTPE